MLNHSNPYREGVRPKDDDARILTVEALFTDSIFLDLDIPQKNHLVRLILQSKQEIDPEQIEKLTEKIKTLHEQTADTKNQSTLRTKTGRAFSTESFLHIPGMFNHWIAKLEASNLDNEKFKQLASIGRNTIQELHQIRHLQVSKPNPNFSNILTEQQTQRIKQLPDSKQKQLLAKVLSRISNETDYFRVLSELNLVDKINQGIDNGKFAARTLFIKPTSLFGRLLSSFGLSGFASPSLAGSIVVNCVKPTASEILESLGHDATLPRSLRILEHELTHRMQVESNFAGYIRAVLGAFIAGKSIQIITSLGIVTSLYVAQHNSNLFFLCLFATTYFTVTQGMKIARTLQQAVIGIPDGAIIEVQPREAEAASCRSDDFDICSITEILKQMAGYRLLPKDQERLVLAFKNIRTLRLLGKTDLEITKSLQGAYYDPLSKTYPKLDKAVQVAFAEWKAATPEDQKILYHALETANQARRDLNRLKVVNIVKEELGNV